MAGLNFHSEGLENSLLTPQSLAFHNSLFSFQDVGQTGCLPVCLSAVILPEYLTPLDCSINFWPPHSYLQFSIVLLETAGSISFKWAMHSLVPTPHQTGEGLVTFSWFFGLHQKFIAYCIHSCIINMPKRYFVNVAKVAKNFLCCNHRVGFLQCEWRVENPEK